MTRLFTSSPCHMCRRLPPWGWLYCCTQDKELSLAEGIEKGSVGPMDDLAERLTRGVKPTKKGPELRSDRFSALTELTQAELATYTPEELVIILKQREHLQNVLRRERSRRLKPWVPNSDRECQFRVCHLCRATSEDRAYLSLNAVLAGDIPPTAATGYGFGGLRPIAHPDTVKNLGLRPVPLRHPASRSAWTVLDVIDDPDELDDSSLFESHSSSSSSRAPLDYDAPGARSVGLVPVLSGCPQWVAAERFSRTDENLSPPDLLIRPPWTPPPSPASSSCPTGEAEAEEGRSPMSLRTNVRIRRAILASIFPSLAVTLMRQQGLDKATNQIDSFAGTQPERVPLPRPTVDEIDYFFGNTAAVEPEAKKAKDETTEFYKGPLHDAGGIAVTEEGVELGAPDVTV